MAAVAWGVLGRGRRRGFTLVELVLVICILGILAVVGVPKYVDMTKAAESAGVETVTGALAEALNLYLVKQTTSNLPVAAHNPFDDLTIQPKNYAGAFDDVDLTNCRAGFWAYQAGGAANNNWPVVVYRAKATLASAFGWGGVQWLVFEVRATTDPDGRVTALGLVEYPPVHQW